MLIPVNGEQGELKGPPYPLFAAGHSHPPARPRRVGLTFASSVLTEPLSVYSTSGSATADWNSPLTIGRSPESNVHLSIAREAKTVPRIISNQPLVVSVQGVAQALTIVGTPPRQTALRLAMRAKRGEPVVA